MKITLKGLDENGNVVIMAGKAEKVFHKKFWVVRDRHDENKIIFTKNIMVMPGKLYLLETDFVFDWQDVDPGKGVIFSSRDECIWYLKSLFDEPYPDFIEKIVLSHGRYKSEHSY